MSLHNNQPPNNAIQCARNVVFTTTVGGGTPHPPPSRSWPPLTNPGCTTVTGIAKMQKGPCSPLIGVKEIFKRGNIYGIGTYATSHNYALIMSFSMFSVEENAVFIHEFSFKKSHYRGRGDTTPSPPPPPPPRSLRSLGLGRFAPSHITAPPKIKSWLRHCADVTGRYNIYEALAHFLYRLHVVNLFFFH